MRRELSWDWGMPRAEARLVAREEVDFWSRGGIGVVPVLANGRVGWGVCITSLLVDFPFVELVVGSSFSSLSEVKLPPSTTVSRPPNAVISFSIGRSAFSLQRAAQRSCSLASSSSVRRASGSFVSFAAEEKEVAARAWDEAAARSVAGGYGAGVDWRMLDAWEAW